MRLCLVVLSIKEISLAIHDGVGADAAADRAAVLRIGVIRHRAVSEGAVGRVGQLLQVSAGLGPR